MRTAALHVTIIALAFAWAWFTGEVDEMNLVYLPKEE